MDRWWVSRDACLFIHITVLGISAYGMKNEALAGIFSIIFHSIVVDVLIRT